ncbi:MAG: transcriptional repressor [Chloroflexota bacterium]
MYRVTKQKVAILRVLRSTMSHPTADWVYGEIRKEIPNVSLGTIYRNLRLLEKEGEIRELGLAGGPSRFDANTQPHHHFRCEKCERIFDVSIAVDKGIDARVSRETGFKVFSHAIEFRGLCRNCRGVVDT